MHAANEPICRMAARQKDRVAGSPVMYLDPEQTEIETVRA